MRPCSRSRPMSIVWLRTMADARRLTLLQLAIFAMIAIVPVLIAVLLIVATTREADLARPKNSDRHMSVRHLAALKTFELAIVRRDRVQSGPPSAEVLLARFPQCAREWDGR